MYPGLDTFCRVSRRSKRSSIKAGVHKTADIKAHLKRTSTSKTKHMSITAKYNKGINQYTHHNSSASFAIASCISRSFHFSFIFSSH